MNRNYHEFHAIFEGFAIVVKQNIKSIIEYSAKLHAKTIVFSFINNKICIKNNLSSKLVKNVSDKTSINAFTSLNIQTVKKTVSHQLIDITGNVKTSTAIVIKPVKSSINLFSHKVDSTLYKYAMISDYNDNFISDFNERTISSMIYI